MKSPRSTPHCIACAVAWLAVVWIDFASAACDSDIGGFVSLSGAIEVQSAGTGPWTAADLTTRLCEGDSVRVGERSRAAIALANNGVLRLDQTTTIRLLNIAGDNEEESLLELVKGVFQSFSRKPHKLTINTPYLNGSIEGTEFIARSGTNSAEFTVFEGIVVTSNAQGRLALKPGESARATAGQAPSLQLLVKPRDGAQWALY